MFVNFEDCISPDFHESMSHFVVLLTRMGCEWCECLLKVCDKALMVACFCSKTDASCWSTLLCCHVYQPWARFIEHPGKMCFNVAGCSEQQVFSIPLLQVLR